MGKKLCKKSVGNEREEAKKKVKELKKAKKIAAIAAKYKQN